MHCTGVIGFPNGYDTTKAKCLEALDAVQNGADAVYLAGTSFGMRSFAGNFSDEELPRAVDFAHRHGVKVHATVNTMPRSGEVDRLPEHLEKLNAIVRSINEQLDFDALLHTILQESKFLLLQSKTTVKTTVVCVKCLNQTLKRNRTTSPSCITYSLPSERTRPFSRAAASEPSSMRSL